MTHTHFHNHTLFLSVRLLWTKDRPVAETTPWQHTTLTRDRHPCHQRCSNPQSQLASDSRSIALEHAAVLIKPAFNTVNYCPGGDIDSVRNLRPCYYMTLSNTLVTGHKQVTVGFSQQKTLPRSIANSIVNHCTVIPRLTKIILSGITFISRNFSLSRT